MPTWSTKRPRAGLSLIELIVVLAIAGILLAVGVASIKPRDQVQVDQFVRQVAGVVQKARYEAIVRNTFTRFSVAGSGLSVEVDTNPILEIESYVALESVSAGGNGFELVTVAVNSVGSALEFEPRGIVRGVPIEFVVRSASDPAYGYVVDVSSQGRVLWERE